MLPPLLNGNHDRQENKNQKQRSVYRANGRYPTRFLPKIFDRHGDEKQKQKWCAFQKAKKPKDAHASGEKFVHKQRLQIPYGGISIASIVP